MAKGGSSSGSPNTVLVIFLVFFVLATIGLGVTTYIGFDGQTQLIADKDVAVKKAREWEATADWFKFQALAHRMAIGEKLNDDDAKAFAVLKGRYDNNKGLQASAVGDLRKEDGGKAVDVLLLSPQLRFIARDNRFEVAFPDLVKKADKDLEVARTELTKTKDDLKAEQVTNAGLDASVVQQKDLFTAGLAKNRNESKGDLDKKLNFTENVPLRLAELGKENEELQAKMGQMLEDHAKQVTNLNKKIAQLTAAVDKLQAAASQRVNIFDYDHPKGKITEIDRTGTRPFINIGLADNLKPGVTFSVYGVGVDGKPIAHDIIGLDGKPIIGTDGKPEKEGKATVEVTAVLGPHLSQVSATSVRDVKSDPILRGDLLFNPGWDPNLQQHVAVAGLIDLSGEGRDDLEEFRRMLDKNRVVIDAYLDLREMSVKGPGITRKTDFLVLGDIPEYGGSATRDDDPRQKRRQEAINEMTKMQEEAAKNGVTVISLRKFLTLSGFKVVRTTTTREGDNPLYRQPLTPKAADKPAAPADVPPKP